VPDSDPQVALFALSTALFAQRDGQILVLKRAGGAVTGGWYLPGGVVDPGETVEEGARRELLEESGLTASGPLTVVAVAHMHVYGYDSLQILYACDCAHGEVVLSDEHSGARWVDPKAYRDRYFSDDVINTYAGANTRVASMLTNIRSAIDAYLRWREIAYPRT
jgi:8-oxo-dGTP pyrophosphatase MutT (NUDIX family)